MSPHLFKDKTLAGFLPSLLCVPTNLEMKDGNTLSLPIRTNPSEFFLFFLLYYASVQWIDSVSRARSVTDWQLFMNVIPLGSKCRSSFRGFFLISLQRPSERMGNLKPSYLSRAYWSLSAWYKSSDVLNRSVPVFIPLQLFSDVAYKARDREDLIAGIDEFLDEVIVLPPGEWDPKIRIEPPKKVPSADKRLEFQHPSL